MGGTAYFPTYETGNVDILFRSADPSNYLRRGQARVSLHVLRFGHPAATDKPREMDHFSNIVGFFARYDSETVAASDPELVKFDPWRSFQQSLRYLFGPRMTRTLMGVDFNVDRTWVGASIALHA